jgi:hypothetical protein
VVYLLISTSVWDQSGIIIGVYVSLKDDLERIKARNDVEEGRNSNKSAGKFSNL